VDAPVHKDPIEGDSRTTCRWLGAWNCWNCEWNALRRRRRLKACTKRQKWTDL